MSARNRKCQRLGTICKTRINGEKVQVVLELPGVLALTSKEAEEMEQEIHDALECIVAKRWHRVRGLVSNGGEEKTKTCVWRVVLHVGGVPSRVKLVEARSKELALKKAKDLLEGGDAIRFLGAFAEQVA